ncbi:hypothetical protein [Chamaesiphon sp. GL140_3_metabinner_50]|uniref:hypothetical protein n=1 Tax=Chamaesiphon sp. GL140_3_metabinner_50 TaxID=2970812 RepID=UPI0025F97708|nr:hypothetical protein [Chamaesiphon sp. GL140_3_metabinner_50]
MFALRSVNICRTGRIQFFNVSSGARLGTLKLLVLWCRSLATTQKRVNLWRNLGTLK